MKMRMKEKMLCPVCGDETEYRHQADWCRDTSGCCWSSNTIAIVERLREALTGSMSVDERGLIQQLIEMCPAQDGSQSSQKTANAVASWNREILSTCDELTQD